MAVLIHDWFRRHITQDQILLAVRLDSVLALALFFNLDSSRIDRVWVPVYAAAPVVFVVGGG
jgi:hypothetical protein